MRAVVYDRPGTPLRVEELPDPTPGPGELVLKVEACGICGSDLHTAQHFPMPGLVFGHEFCGTVAAIGADVEGWREGDRVAGLSLVGCGWCGPCLDGRTRKCAECQMIGIDRPGAYADYVKVGAAESHRLPDGLDARLGAVVEPLSVALHSVVRAGLQPGDDVVVLGGGPVGLAVTLWLRRLGAGVVLVSDPMPARRALAEQLGATATADPTVVDVRGVFAEHTGHPPRLVVECVGVPGLLQHAVDVVATDGVVVVTGVCMAPDQIFPLTAMMKELDVRFSFYYRNADYATTLRELDTGGIDPSPMITREVGLDDAPAAFASLLDPATAAAQCKVLIRP